MTEKNKQDKSQSDPILPIGTPSQQILDASPSMMMLVDAQANDYPIVYVNAAFEKATGYTRSEVIGRNPRFLQHNDRDQPAVTQIRTALKADQGCTAILRNYNKDGSMFWNELRIIPLRDQNNAVTHFLGSLQDVTERIFAEQIRQKQQEDVLLQTESRYKTVLEHFPNGMIAMYDHDLRYTVANGQGLAEIGLKPSDLEGKRLRDVFPQDVYERDEPALLAALQGERVVSEVALGDMHFRVITAPVTDYNGQVIGGMVMSQNITAQKQAEIRLLASEAALQRAQAIAHVGSWEIDLDTWENTWSDEFYRICGLEPGSIPPSTENWLSILHPDERSEVQVTLRLSRSVGTVYKSERRIIRPDGTLRWVVSSGEVIIAVETGKHKLVGTIQDITERKKQIERIQREEERYRSIIIAMSEGVIVYDADGVIITCNDAAVNILRIEADVLTGMHVSEVPLPPIHEDGSPFALVEFPVVTTLATGEPRMNVVMGFPEHVDGRTTWVSLNTQPLVSRDSGETFGVVTTFTDITEPRAMRERAFDEAIHRERANILSKFIRDTSHELRTPLSVISTSSYFLRRSDDPDFRARHADKVIDQIKRLTTLIDMLLLMSKLDSGVDLLNEDCHVNTIVDAVFARVVPMFEAKNQRFLPEIESVQLTGDPGLLTELLTQLLSNAGRYTPEHGTVILRMVEDDQTLVIDVIDDGIGIIEEDMPYIFDHFWRHDDSHVEPGFGLGLTVSKKIVELHNGTITVDSVAGEGTAVQVRLPLTP